MHVEIKLPEEIGKRLQTAWRDVSRGTLQAIATEAYRDGTLTRDEVSQLLGFSFWETEAFLKERQAYLDYGLEDLQKDRASLDRLDAR